MIKLMKSLKLIPQCWEAADVSPSRSTTTSPSKGTTSSRSTVPPTSPRTPPRRQLVGDKVRGVDPSRGLLTEERGGDGSQLVTPQQMAKLKDYFGNITVSPVKQVHTGEHGD